VEDPLASLLIFRGLAVESGREGEREYGRTKGSTRNQKFKEARLSPRNNRKKKKTVPIAFVD
jgi:hypothetical protein